MDADRVEATRHPPTTRGSAAHERIEEPEDTIHVAPYDAVYIGRDRAWVQPVGGQPIEASARVLRALSALASAPSLEAMTDAAGRAMGVASGELASLRGELQRLAEHGLLTSGAALVHRCAESAPVAAHALELLSVPTYERPAALERCAHSYLDAAQRFDRRLELSILDDAQTANARARTRAVATSLARRGGCTVRYAGSSTPRAGASCPSTTTPWARPGRLLARTAWP